MTARFKQKVRKWRGRTSHGGGHKKKRRGGGSQGGRGYGGSHKHKFSYITTIEPDHYGYKGFHSRKKKGRTINIDELVKLEGSSHDLKKLGYSKLLGKGRITKPVTVRVNEASKQAKEKIEKAGGKVELIKAKERPKTESRKRGFKKPDEKAD